jgi:hypothetical protein
MHVNSGWLPAILAVAAAVLLVMLLLPEREAPLPNKPAAPSDVRR